MPPFFAPLMAFLAKPAAATLVGAGSAALSSIAQTRNANKMANQGTDLGKLRREAEANGFNPLTVLRATGGQGFKQNVSMGSGALASASFFNAFAGLGQNIAQAKQQEATLKNTMASTANYTAQTRALSSAAQGSQRDPDAISLYVPVVDPSGNLEPFNIINPEVIESSANEAASSLAMIASQYALQHNISVSKAMSIVRALGDNRGENIASAAFPIKTTHLPAGNVPGSFQPGKLSIDWFKQKIDNAIDHKMFDNGPVADWR
jgi:hypothetical protein